jgi:predicted nucleic acid-binding protein
VIVVDSSVWIDYFRDADTPQVETLDSLLGTEAIAVGDLILAEVLQGIDSDREFRTVLQLMQRYIIIEISGEAVAIEAARNYRRLRSLGVTVRKTIDTLIATRCIIDGHELLYSDRDFDPFVEHLGLGVVATH